MIDGTIVYLFGFAGLLAGGYLLYPTLKSMRDKNVAKNRKKAMKKLKEIKEEVKAPEGVPPPTPEVVGDGEKPMEQFPIPQSIAIELTRMKEGTKKRVTVRKGKVTLIPRFGAGKEGFWFYVGQRGYFIDPKHIIDVETKGRGGKIIKTEKLVYDVLSPEPLNQKGELIWSWDIEHLMRDSAMDQYITVATFEQGFQLTPGLLKALIIVGLLGILMGLALNGSAGLTPKELIHYVP